MAARGSILGRKQEEAIAALLTFRPGRGEKMMPISTKSGAFVPEQAQGKLRPNSPHLRALISWPRRRGEGRKNAKSFTPAEVGREDRFVPTSRCGIITVQCKSGPA